MRRFSPSRLPLASGVACLALLSGCSGTLVVDAAPHATDPECASVMLRMPDAIDGHKQRATSSQGTTAWGDPAAAIVRCGMNSPGPTTDHCVNVGGVDWISTEQNKNSWKFVSYGRSPAVEVLVDPRAESGANALNAISPAVAYIKQDRKCENAADISKQGTPETPSASPTR